MKAYTLTDYIGPDGLQPADVAPPESADEIVLDVKAIGVNFPDLLMIKGQYQYRPELPVVPGCEIAGTVRSAPTGSGWEMGERAAAFIWNGGFAERAIVPLNSIVRIPDSMTFEFAAGMVVNYHTVHFALARRGALKEGETVLVMGAAGGIGTAAVQVARGLGARVIAGVADEGQVATALAAGAAEVLVLSEGFASKIGDATDGRGADLVLDPLGDWLFDEALRALAPEGRLLVVGFAAGKVPQVKVHRILHRNVGVIGAAFGAFLDSAPGLMQSQAESLDRMVAEGVVAPAIGNRFAFDELPDALRQLERGAIRGKAVINL